MVKKLLKNDFNKNILTLLTGTIVAQAIPVAISPILTRIYSPQDFGVLALFIAITSIFGSIANARYEMAIVLPTKDEDAINVAALAVIISSILSVLLLIVVIIFGGEIALLLGESSIESWLYIVPISVFFIGLYNVFNYLNTRDNNYKTISSANIMKAVSLSIVQLVLGFFLAGASGLILGQVSSFIFGNVNMGKKYMKDKELIKEINGNQMKEMAKKYIDFPKFSMWSILANTLSRNSVNIFLSTFYSLGTLGYYSLVQRILGLPSQIIGRSIGQVFYRQCITEKQKYGNAKKLYKSTFYKLLLISTPSFLILYFIAEDLITFVFGADWSIAGTYTKILVPLFFIRFITLPLSMVNGAFEKQKVALFWQVLLFVVTVAIFFVSYILNLNVETFLQLLTWISFLLHLLLLVMTYKVSWGKL